MFVTDSRAHRSAVRSNTLPCHGRIACRRCFSQDGDTQTIGKWQIVNDPAAWGSANPTVLVLGFSKGFTQANAFRSEQFEDIPFKGMRSRLTEELRLIGVLGAGETVDEKMVDGEREFAFGSLVRCSLSRLDAKGRLACTGAVMPKAFSEEVSACVERCAETFLGTLPASVRLVLMLGTSDGYVEGCRKLIRALNFGAFSNINSVSYRTGTVVWAHISHPSGLNGHHPTWMAGDRSTKPGLKRVLAMEAIRSIGLMLRHQA
jgi:hypothetical protein